MKILVVSYAFSPSKGGIETVSRILADEFVRLGHEVIVVTDTPCSQDSNEQSSYAVFRKLSFLKLLTLTKWADITWHNNFSTRYFFPILITGKPLVVTHQTFRTTVERKKSVKNFLQHKLINKFVHSIFISKTMLGNGLEGQVIPNPFDNRYFSIIEGIARTKDLAFVGRLVSDKGADVLLEAISILKQKGKIRELTVIGDGPELSQLKAMTISLSIHSQVNFLGAKNPKEIAEILNAHKVLIVPSRWAEPFGIVALEGIACGCAIIGSAKGGLPEAIGQCGLLFNNGDPNELANLIEQTLTNNDLLHSLISKQNEHLSSFLATTIAADYIKIFRTALKTKAV